MKRAIVTGASWLAVLALPPGAGCRARPELPPLDLLESAAHVELRSDTVDLPFLVDQRSLEHGGWRSRRTESGVLWSRAPEAWLELPFATRGPKELRLSARARRDLGPQVDVTVSLNGTSLGTVRLGPREQHFRFLLSESAQRQDRNLLHLAVQAWKDRVEADANTLRPWIAVTKLEARPLGTVQRDGLPGRSQGTLRLPPSSAASFYLRENTGFRVELVAEAKEATRVELSLAGSEPRKTLLDLALQPARQRSASVEARPGADGFIHLEVANSGTEEATVRTLKLRRPLPETTREPPAAAARAAFLQSPRPNVILFLVDTLRADYLSLYGHPRETSPRLHDFGREAITFDDCGAHSSWTAPSVASLFTGLGPQAHGVVEFDSSLVGDLETLAERFHAHGYHTGAFVANHVVRPPLGFGQGFEVWNGARQDSLYRKRPGQVVERALEWLQSTEPPFFLYVHVLDPHEPYTPAAEHARRFEYPGYRGSRDTRALIKSRVPLRSEEVAFLRSAYEGEIHETDAAFGAFTGALRSRGQLDSSVVVFTADHGEEFNDHGAAGHGHTLYRELLRVPLVVRLPAGALAGERVLPPVQHVDVFSTLTAVVNGGKEGEGDGRPLWEAFASSGREVGEARLAFAHAQFSGSNKASLRQHNLKLILNREATIDADSRLQLFDLAADPEERRNLAATRPIAAHYLRARLAEIEEVQAERRLRLGAGEKVELTPEDKERLRALGYLGR